MLELTYGAGLWVSETIRLLVKDLDFEIGLVLVRAAKGYKCHSTLLPQAAVRAASGRSFYSRPCAGGGSDIGLQPLFSG